MSKVALVTGSTGQDGAHLAELILGKGYIVHGIKRRSSSFNSARIDHIYQDPHVPDTQFQIQYGDMTDLTNLIRIIQAVQPDEVDLLLGAPSKARKLLGWRHKVSFADLVSEMVSSDLKVISNEKNTREHRNE